MNNQATICAEFDICWERDTKAFEKEGIDYINSQLNATKENTKIYSKLIDEKIVYRWEWSTENIETYHVDEVLEKILVHFFDKIERIQDIKKELTASIVLEVVIEMKKNQSPSLVISEEIINFMSKVGGYIDIDMYII